MSSEGEYWIDEVEAAVRDEVNARIGDEWYLHKPRGFYNIWRRDEIPIEGEVPIVQTKTDGSVYEKVAVVGKVRWRAKNVVADDGFGKYVDTELVSAKVVWFREPINLTPSTEGAVHEKLRRGTIPDPEDYIERGYSEGYYRWNPPQRG